MSITKRQEQILSLVNEKDYMSVSRLAELMYTSESSIRRDLTVLENNFLIKRTHGGASALHNINEPVPLRSRMKKNIQQKRYIARLASDFLHDGQSVMLDGSSTAGFLVPYIAKRKGIILFTNNMQTAINAVGYGIETHCLGGVSVNNSAVVSGEMAYRAAQSINPDILFFSSQCLDDGGMISDPIPEENHIRSIMLERARESVFLCDSDKFSTRALYTLANIDKIDVCVFDSPYTALKSKCKIIY